jgi:hypothetical protein
VRGPRRVIAAVAATALAAGCSAATAARTTTSTAPTVNQASVTGYESGDPASQSAGPVTVVLRGKTAAHLDQVLNSLPRGGSMDCHENVLLYNITFTLASSFKTIDVAGYACVAAVQVTEDGKETLRTDNGCTLLAAVRRALPATAVATQQGSAACDS